MVVSASHAERMSDLSSADADAFMTLLTSVTRDVEQSTGAHCYVLRIGDKSTHLHFHIVPRAPGDRALAAFVFGETGWSGGSL